MSETEPEVEAEETEEEYDNPGLKGQIQYPEPEVDAERAAAFAAGLVDTLEPEEDEGEADEGDGEDDGE